GGFRRPRASSGDGLTLGLNPEPKFPRPCECLRIMEKKRSPWIPLAVVAVAIAAAAIWYVRRTPEEPPAVAQAPAEPAKPADAPLRPPAHTDPQLPDSPYHKLGYPDRSFDQLAGKALKRIIDAPVLDKAPRLVPKGANFAYEDEKLEALGPVEKLLLRMGPRNTRLIQNKAREIA